jgi:hypothetical protein
VVEANAKIDDSWSETRAGGVSPLHGGVTMATEHNPRVLEGYIAMQEQNIAQSLQQIRTGMFPQYDDNCRQDVGECLLQIANARERQLELDSNYPIGLPIRIFGLSEASLPPNMTLKDFRRIQQFIDIRS